MSGAYRQCDDCGKRALSVATRCPGCGRELPPKPERRGGRTPDLGRYLPLLAVAGVLAAGTVAVTAVLGRADRGAVEGAVEVETSSIAQPAPRVDTATAAASPATSTGELLVSRTWTHVRNRRTVTGDVEAVLLPGDTVLADSLSRGWYRVALEGEVLGYAHRSTLMTAGPEAPGNTHQASR